MAGTIGDGERQKRLAMKNGGDGERKTLAVPTTRDEYPPNNTTSSTLQQLSTTAKDGDESKIVGDSLETGDPVGSTAANENSNDAPVSNIQKKIRRAEPFGMPVQLSEEEKRNSRAERIVGTAVKWLLRVANSGTVACGKVDNQRTSAAATSSGGFVNKMVERIGGLPIVGAVQKQSLPRPR
ncbi:hypothetical protein F0562_013519 [Nyssa sinensis]|uniref:THO1-MOS11 C-terminal domain-containing protein n=1 Tax=Nyssa sinensis TaxID=561372 RepID=A0A5J4ZKF8_9ASTE|nr:hypothetical protein F0562_013519 [Nyssa sinensis]